MPSLNTGNAILSNPIKVDSSYNVGIGGAASGSYKLQVTGASNFTDNLTMTIASGTKSIGFGGNTIAAAANALIYSDTNYLVLNSKAGSPLYLNFDNANASSTINMFNGKFILTQPGAATFSSSVTAAGNINANGTLRLRNTSFGQINSGDNQTITIISAPGATAFRALQVVVIGFEQENGAIFQLKFDIIARWSGATIVNTGLGNLVRNYSRGIGDFVGMASVTPSIGTSGNSLTLNLANSSSGYINNIVVNITENLNG